MKITIDFGGTNGGGGWVNIPNPLDKIQDENVREMAKYNYLRANILKGQLLERGCFDEAIEFEKCFSGIGDLHLKGASLDQRETLKSGFMKKVEALKNGESITVLFNKIIDDFKKENPNLKWSKPNNEEEVAITTVKTRKTVISVIKSALKKLFR